MAWAAKKILVLDGAMGTMLQQLRLQEIDFRGTRFRRHTLPLLGYYDLLSLSQPQLVQNIHLQYLNAGADIISTNSFCSQTITMADYDLAGLAYEVNMAAAQCAVKARSQYYNIHGPHATKFIAGAMGPTNRLARYALSADDPSYRYVRYNELVQAYKEQAKGLLEGGVDILLVETIYSPLNATAAFDGILSLLQEQKIQIPLMASATLPNASGEQPAEHSALLFAQSLAHIPLVSIGFNCALGAAQLKNNVAQLADVGTPLISVHPNAGLPNIYGLYEDTAPKMAKILEEYLQDSMVNIIGGCCGTTPNHIRAIASMAKGYKPRETSTPK